jgi:hypothetical protein
VKSLMTSPFKFVLGVRTECDLLTGHHDYNLHLDIVTICLRAKHATDICMMTPSPNKLVKLSFLHH